MAKPKTGSVPNKALYSRVSFLYQAATYMATQRQNSQPMESLTSTDTKEACEQSPETTLEKTTDPQVPLSHSASRHLVSELRAVSHKVLMRMSPAMKHSLCKNCDTIMVDGATCTSTIENKSKGGKKPWADLLVRRCNTCGLKKRFPLNTERQKRRPQRQAPKPTEIYKRPS
ncbi:RNAse P Rpr2/Rpp21/SNM1 subunit domain-containing protein [Cadophora sp. MPI-SDFR-AT-0126]|nr:RNAse P Rpr2/Rpp21/SNM1 subunit domain-containing protein [Leotiomycetes sp. MPI-SDFR-AT-0126]